MQKRIKTRTRRTRIKRKTCRKIKRKTCRKIKRKTCRKIKRKTCRKNYQRGGWGGADSPTEIINFENKNENKNNK